MFGRNIGRQAQLSISPACQGITSRSGLKFLMETFSIATQSSQLHRILRQRDNLMNVRVAFSANAAPQANGCAQTDRLLITLVRAFRL